MFLVLIVFVVSVLIGSFSRVALAEQSTLSGWIHFIWGNGPTPPEHSSSPEMFLIDEEGQWIPLRPGIHLSTSSKPFKVSSSLNRQRVTVLGNWKADRPVPIPKVHFEAVDIQLDQSVENPASPSPAGPLGITGTQPWATLLCRFADLPGVTPHPPAWFTTLMGTSFPGLGHYWKAISNQQIDLSGSAVVGWYDLPQPESFYVIDNKLDFGKAATDCTAAADGDLFFPGFIGLNLMFNGNLDGKAWGGGSTFSLDGETKAYMVTWLPIWGYKNQKILSHEMGHGFGLPHSSGPYNAIYDSQWDVMSGGGTCSAPDGTYGCVAVHTISHHKDLLGWIPTGRKYKAAPVTTKTLTLEFLGEPFSGNNYLMAEIPIAGSNTLFYTVEARRLNGYDSQIPGEAILIHRVDTTRTDRVAQVIDIDNNGNANDAAAMWTVGETFTDKENGITISVDAATPNGYLVTIQLDASIENDPFSGRIEIIGLSGQASGKNGAATKETGEPDHATNPGGKSVWWKWMAPGSGVVTFDTTGSSFDTVLAVYTGSAVNSLTEVATNDDQTPGVVTSKLTFIAQAGLEYQIAVDGFNGATGNIILNWELPSADLSVTLTDGPDPVTAGTDLTYTFAIGNAGVLDATNVILSDNLPSELQNPVFSTDGGTNWSSWNSALNLGTMVSGGSKSVLIRGRIDPLFIGTITHNATVQSGMPDPVTANNAVSETTTVQALADLGLTQSDLSDPVIAAQTLTYTLQVNNNGPSMTRNVTVSDTLPVGVNFVDASGTGWTCNKSINQVSCHRPTLPPGGAPDITLTLAAPTEGGVLTNSATIGSDTPEAMPTNNNTSETTTVLSSTDLSITMTDASDPLFVGNHLKNTMTIVNHGPSSASGISLSYPLETGLLFVSATASLGNCNELNQAITCLVGNLSAGKSAIIDIVVTPTIAGSLTRTAQVTATESDPDSADNSASEITLIDTLPFSLGLGYGPFREGQNPGTGVFPSLTEINEDVKQMSFWTASLRSYSVLNGFDQIILKAGLEGMKVMPGAAIGHGNPLADENEISSLVTLANNNSHVIGAIVGNEVLTQSLQMTKADLIARMTQVKDGVNVPVTTCEGPDVWKNPANADLAAAVEFICLNIHPWWAGVNAANAGAYLMTAYNEVKAVYPGKLIIIGETGWPTDGTPRGAAVPSAQNQKLALENMVSEICTNEITTFLFEMFDEGWKTGEGDQGPHWGFHNRDRTRKHGGLKLSCGTMSLPSDQIGPTTSASLPSGIYDTAQSLNLVCSDTSGSGCYETYYTTDGTTPTLVSDKFVNTITISETTTFQFFSLDHVGNFEGVQSLSFKINRPPLAHDQTFSTSEDQPGAITLKGSDPDGDALIYTIVTPPSLGILNGTPPEMTYHPDADTVGSDSFTFKISDGRLDANIATVSINITPVNDPPVCRPVILTTDEDTPGSTLPDCTDVEGDDLIVTIVTQPLNGTASGSLNYNPDPHFNGADAFSYKAHDGTSDSTAASVNVTVIAVNDVPVAEDQSLITTEKIPLPIALSGRDIDSDVLTFSIHTPPANGTLSGLNGNTGKLTYTPNTTYVGTDSFLFQVNDGLTNSPLATISINIFQETGLLGEYFNNADLSDFIKHQVDPAIDFTQWGLASPDGMLAPDTFSVRWTGKLRVDQNEEVTFHTITDDGLRLWIDGHLLLDHWQTGEVSNEGTMSFSKGLHDIKLEFFEDTGKAAVQLFWSTPSKTIEIIPSTHLFPPKASGTAPRLDWVGEAGYTSDGLEPQTGGATTQFSYRLSYSDGDGDFPLEKFPRVHILAGGKEINGSPFVMIHETGSPGDGAIYTYSTHLPEGADYRYYFDAVDATGRQAISTPITPTPTVPIQGPNVNSADLDGSGRVDGLDLGRLGLAFGSQLGDPNWDSAADLNQDGRVDIIDLDFLKKNFGKTK